MLRTVFAVLGLGLAAGACSYSSTTTAAIPAAPGPVVVATPAAHACVDYGFVPGTIAYNRCVERTEAARVHRTSATYTEAQAAADARNACASYGLVAGLHYDRCVDREMEARRLRPDQAAVYVPPQAALPPVPPAPPAGVQAFRDEYGFRYDGQGNRLDAHGNIISPQSTRP